MADLTGVNDTLPVRLGGVSSTNGLPDYYSDVLPTGQLKVAISDASGSALNSTSNALNVYLTNTTVAVTQSTSPWITKDLTDGPVTPGTAASFSQLIGGVYNSTSPTLTNGQQSAIQLDSSGKLLVDSTIANDIYSTGTITTQDLASTSTTYYNGQVWYSGTPTAGSFVSFTTPNIESGILEISGTWTGTVQAEVSVDGGTNWILHSLHQIGSADFVTSFTSNFSGSLNLAAKTNFRVRAVQPITGTVNIRLNQSLNPSSIYVANAIKLLDGSAVTSSTLMNIVAGSTAASSSNTAVVVGLSPNSPLPAGTNALGSVIVSSTAPPNNITASGTLTGTGQSVTLTLQGTASINVDVSGTGFVGTIQVTEVTPSGGRIVGVFALNSSAIASSITTNGNYKVVGFATNTTLSVSFSSYTSGSAIINIYGSTAPYIMMPYSANASNCLVTSYLNDGSGNAIASIPTNSYTSSSVNFLGTSTNQFIFRSTNNSSTTNLSAGASFTGTADAVINQASINIIFYADQPCSIQVQQSSNGTNWDITDTYYTYANLGDSRSFDSLTSYWRVIVTNTGTISTTQFRLQSSLVPIDNPLPRALSQYGNLQVAVNETSAFGAVAKQLFDDTYDTGLDTTNKWNTPVSSGGGIAASTNTPGSTTLGTGTTANGYSVLTSQPTFRQTAPGFLNQLNAVNLEYPITTNTYRFWGFGISQTTPTATSPLSNAIGYEVSTAGKLYAVTYTSGTRNVIQDLSQSTGNGGQPTDNLVHKYYIYFRGDLTYWAIDELNNVVATLRTGNLGPTINALPIIMLAIAGSTAPSSSGSLTSNAIYVGDTSGLNSQISDGTYPWRKAVVNSDGSMNNRTLDGSGNSINSYNSQLETADIITTGLSSGSITVGTTAVAARVSSTNLANRKMLMISPVTYTVYMGSSSSVTTTTGIPIFPGQVISFAFSANVTPYLISANSGTVNIFEAS